MKKVILVLAVLANLAFSAEELTQAQIEYFDKECEGGNLKYCTAIGEYYFMVGGERIDCKKAKYYFEKVCKMDKAVQKNEYFIESCGNLAAMYYKGIAGIEQNYKEAARLLKVTCDIGDPMACNNLGIMYNNGYGVKKDITKAVSCYKYACNKNNWRGYSSLGAYNIALGNKNTAVKYYKKACELGKNDSEAQNPSNKDFWQLTCELYEKLK